MAVKVAEPGVVDVTVKVTTPFVVEGPEAAEIVSVAPRLEASVTVLPGTGVLLPVKRMTVIVDVVMPSAGIGVGKAVTVELVGLGTKGAKFTVAVCAITILSVVSVAVKEGEPTVVDSTVNVTTPFVPEAPEAADIVSVAPRLEASVTVLPETGLLFASFKVTLIVEAATPSAGNEVGEAVRVELAALTAPTVKTTVAVCATTIPSVVSVAVKMLGPAVVELTVKVTTPAPLEAPEAADIVSIVPRFEASVTVLPETAALLRVNRVTVRVDVVVPLAVTEVGEAVTVELAGWGAPTAKSTVAFCVTTTLSVVAVKAGEPAVVDFTVNVTTPFVPDLPEAAEIVSVAPRLEARVTVLPGTGLLLASFKVTVMVEVLTPSLATVTGLATTVELVALGTMVLALPNTSISL